LVDLFCGAAREVLADLDAMAELEALIKAEPGLRRQLSERELDAVWRPWPTSPTCGLRSGRVIPVG
jgi:hypothetical protein